MVVRYFLIQHPAHNVEQVTYGYGTSDVGRVRLYDDLKEAHDVGSLEISMADVEQPEGEPHGRTVKYCGVCTLPPEYCEYGGTVKKCQEWLEKNEPELYNKIWSAEALEAATASLSVEAQKRAAKDAQKKTAKAEAAEAKHADLLAKSVVTIKRIERNKKKFVTAVIGLESFDLELKKVAKDLGKKFATGSSVTKLPGGGEEIVVQGDVSVELEEFLLEKYKQIPEDHIELVEDKKKKKGGS
ncbi:translation machinery-associated 22 [Fusarium sp. NRRL 52700]|nr:translation machinery-associated 22 [Fusarium sp. NRRL 52700]